MTEINQSLQEEIKFRKCLYDGEPQLLIFQVILVGLS